MAKQKQNPSGAANPALNANAFDNALLRWKAPRYLRYERGWLWFVLLFLVFGGLAFYGYETHSVTMAVAFAILPLVLILEHRKKPDTVEVVISEYGIRFGGMAIPFSDINRFWIIHQMPMINELHIETQNKLHREYVIQLMGLDPTRLRQYLATQIPEWEGKHLSLLETCVRVFKLN